MKKWAALIAMLLAVLMLSGCNLIGYDEALEDAQAVAKVDDVEITKGQWEEYRDYLISTDQNYYLQYYGFTMTPTDDDIAAYGEYALEQMIESVVLRNKAEELGFDPLGEEDAAEVEEYADGMFDFYKLLLRYQNYPDVETVEEEQARLAEEAELSEATPSEATPSEATPSEAVEATPAEPVATITDEMLDAMLTADLEALGYTREYFVESQTASVQSDKLREYAIADVDVTDEQVLAEFESRVADQQETYDEYLTQYVTDVQNGTEVYYVPAGYRGVKNLLVKIPDDVQAEIDELNSTLTTAKSTLSSANSQLETLNATDISEYDEEELAEYNAQIEELTAQAEAAQATVEETEAAVAAATEEAYASILPTAEEALEKALAGEDFDALVEAYGEDTGMTSEPNKSRGYLVCDGLNLYEQSFQDAAMALAQVGDVSAELVQSSYGYHILQYATDIEAGPVEYTDETKTAIYDEMLSEAQDAAYEAAVTQWVSEAKVETFPKVMK